MRLAPVFAAAVVIGLLSSFAWSAMPPTKAGTSQAVVMTIRTPQDIEHSAYYPSCAHARAAGHAPIFKGQPGYREQLDADGDGIACEPIRPN